MRRLPPPLARFARLGAILGLSAAPLLAACDGDRRLPLEVQEITDAPPTLQLSQWTTPGEPARVTVGLEFASRGSGLPVGALQGTLRWNPDALNYVGRVPDLPPLMAVNHFRADKGEIRFALVHVGGIPDLAAVWAFEARGSAGAGPQAAPDVELELSRAYGVDYLERAASVVGPVKVNSNLPSPDRALPFDQEVGTDLLADGSQEMARVPGAAEIYGDATQDGLVQAVDALWTLSAVVGNIECILGSDDPGHDCLAANVHPFNEPGLGEPSDPCPPGLDSCTSWTRTIQSVDALVILDEAVGNDPPIAGELIPVLVAGDTVTLSGVITGTRTLDADTVYRLQGAVAVGEEADGWVGAAGTLDIPAGTRVIAGSGASLSITAAGTILANGTELDPIVFECADALPEPGCWDGIVLAGTAPVNDGQPAGPMDPVPPGWSQMSGDLRTWMGRHFGGGNASHDGGELEYVVISHAGGSGAALTLGGVGDGTTVGFVQTHASSGAGIQLIGGTADASHLLSTANRGDHVRMVNGHQGSLQFVTVQMDIDTTDLVGIRVANGPDDPDVTPRTSPALWNLTVIGGTGFNEEHTGLAFEDAGATVRNALMVRTGTGLAADAGACDRLDVDSLDVDHTVFLGSSDPLAGSCTQDLETAMASGSVDGYADYRAYAGHLVNPFDGELLDDRGDGFAIGAATPSAPLDPTGAFLGANAGFIPWYTGWMRTWTRPSGFAGMPAVPPDSFPSDLFSGADMIADSLGSRWSRSTLGIDFDPASSQAGRSSAIEAIYGTVVGGAPLFDEGYYLVRVPHGDTHAEVQQAIDQLSAQAEVWAAIGVADLEPIALTHRRPDDGSGWSTSDWDLRKDSASGTNWAFEMADFPLAWAGPGPWSMLPLAASARTYSTPRTRSCRSQVPPLRHRS